MNPLIHRARLDVESVIGEIREDERVFLPYSLDAIAGIIDHTLLKPDATPEMVQKICSEAKTYQFFSVCVNPLFVPLAVQELKESAVKVCTVIGFPLGASEKDVKVFEAKQAIRQGADEIDMVIPIGLLKANQLQAVYEDIKGVVKAVHGKGLVKVIIETSLLTDEEKVKACLLAKGAGADFVKTSTGFFGGGATAKDVALMRETVGAKMGVKASGGLKTREDVAAMLHAGATRIGASASIAIVEGGATRARLSDK